MTKIKIIFVQEQCKWFLLIIESNHEDDKFIALWDINEFYI